MSLARFRFLGLVAYVKASEGQHENFADGEIRVKCAPPFNVDMGRACLPLLSGLLVKRLAWNIEGPISLYFGSPGKRASTMHRGRQNMQLKDSCLRHNIFHGSMDFP